MPAATARSVRAISIGSPSGKVTAEAENLPLGEQGKPAVSTDKLSGHVLVVEDNTVNSMLIGTYLEEFGLTYEVVGNGAPALICLAARLYDLVLMDMVLPDYDGLKVAKQIRSMHVSPSEVPIVGIARAGAEKDDLAYVLAGIMGVWRSRSRAARSMRRGCRSWRRRTSLCRSPRRAKARQALSISTPASKIR
jgi:CheY-like chemotaxis protein